MFMLIIDVSYDGIYFSGVYRMTVPCSSDFALSGLVYRFIFIFDGLHPSLTYYAPYGARSIMLFMMKHNPF